MAKKERRLCENCKQEYYGQGKTYCSVECKNQAAKGKPQKKRSEETKLKISKANKGKVISDGQRLKNSEAQKKLWEDTDYRERQKSSRVGRVQSEETREKISNAQKGIPKPSTTLYNLTRPKVSGWHHAEESKARIGEKVSGNRNGMYGKTPTYSKYSMYENGCSTIKMRSTWEVLFAQYLDRLGFSWEYEKHTFNLGDMQTYTPDFYCNGILYEVKGYLHPHSKVKMEQFSKQYPQHTLILVDKKYLKELGLIK